MDIWFSIDYESRFYLYKRRDMVLDDLLNFSFHLWSDAAARNLLK